MRKIGTPGSRLLDLVVAYPRASIAIARTLLAALMLWTLYSMARELFAGHFYKVVIPIGVGVFFCWKNRAWFGRGDS